MTDKRRKEIEQVWIRAVSDHKINIESKKDSYIGINLRSMDPVVSTSPYVFTVQGGDVMAITSHRQLGDGTEDDYYRTIYSQLIEKVLQWHQV